MKENQLEKNRDHGASRDCRFAKKGDSELHRAQQHSWRSHDREERPLELWDLVLPLGSRVGTNYHSEVCSS